MRKTIVAAVVALGMCCMGGCASYERQYKDTVSDLGGGLNRTLTLYDTTGEKIGSWEGKIDVECDGSKVKFDLDGKRTIINGGIVVVQEK